MKVGYFFILFGVLNLLNSLGIGILSFLSFYILLTFSSEYDWVFASLFIANFISLYIIIYLSLKLNEYFLTQISNKERWIKCFTWLGCFFIVNILTLLNPYFVAVLLEDTLINVPILIFGFFSTVGFFILMICKRKTIYIWNNRKIQQIYDVFIKITFYLLWIQFLFGLFCSLLYMINLVFSLLDPRLETNRSLLFVSLLWSVIPLTLIIIGIYKNTKNFVKPKT